MHHAFRHCVIIETIITDGAEGLNPLNIQHVEPASYISIINLLVKNINLLLLELILKDKFSVLVELLLDAHTEITVLRITGEEINHFLDSSLLF